MAGNKVEMEGKQWKRENKKMENLKQVKGERERVVVRELDQRELEVEV